MKHWWYIQMWRLGRRHREWKNVYHPYRSEWFRSNTDAIPSESLNILRKRRCGCGFTQMFHFTKGDMLSWLWLESWLSNYMIYNCIMHTFNFALAKSPQYCRTHRIKKNILTVFSKHLMTDNCAMNENYQQHCVLHAMNFSNITIWHDIDTMKCELHMQYAPWNLRGVFALWLWYIIISTLLDPKGILLISYRFTWGVLKQFFDCPGVRCNREGYRWMVPNHNKSRRSAYRVHNSSYTVKPLV